MSHVPNRPWPTRCEMPDLSSLDEKVSLDLMLNRVFAGGGPKDARATVMVANYVRIVDMLIAEYKATRESLIEFVTTPNNVIYPLFAAIGHAEECVSNLLRAIRFGRRIKRDRSIGSNFHKSLFVSDAIETCVRDFRNAIQHLDDELHSGSWVSGSPHCLVTYDDCMAIYDKTITYVELADWITDLHALAVLLAQFKEP